MHSESRFFVRLSIVGLCLFGAGVLGASGLSSFEPTAAPTSSLPDLVIAVVILGEPATVSPGEEFSYVFVVTNQGSDMPIGSTTKVLDQLPSRVTVITWMEGARAKEPQYLGVTCTFSAPALTCVGPPLVQDDWYVVRIIVQVNDDATGGNLVNLAFADPLGEVVESNENNNLDKWKVKIQ